MTEVELPFSTEAEQYLLSCCIVNDHAVDAALDIIGADDFYWPEHTKLFSRMAELHGENKVVDMATLSSEGADVDFLGHLLELPAVSARASDYARQLRDLAIRRRVIRAGRRIIDVAEGNPDASEVMDAAETELYAARGRDTTDGPSAIADTLVDVYHDLGEHEPHFGLRTHIHDVNEIIVGMTDGSFNILAARPGQGKAQPLDAKVLTPRGWTHMGRLRLGDEVVGGDGRSCRVLGIFPQGRIPVARVVFRDGETRASYDHLWVTSTRSERRRGVGTSVKTTAEIAESIARPDGCGLNHHIPPTPTVSLGSDGGRHPLHPYLLGLWLGDGCATGSFVISNPEPHVYSSVRRLSPAGDEVWRSKDGITIRARGGNSLRALRELGLYRKRSYERFVPREYIFASERNRMALVRGLIDSDGSMDNGGGVDWSTSSERMAGDMTFLCRSLGASVRERKRSSHYMKDGKRVGCRTSYRLRIVFPPGECPTASEKNIGRYSEHPHWQRAIVDVIPDGEAECQCILVDGPDHTYVTDDFIVTHNTCMALDISRHVSKETKVLFFSVEMTKREIAERLVAAEGTVGLTKLRTGTMDEREELAARQAILSLSERKMVVDDSSTTMYDVQRKVRRAAARGGLGLVVVDYIQLLNMGSRGKQESRQYEVAQISRAMKLMAREYDIPVIGVSQLSRPERKFDGEKSKVQRPNLASLRDSGALEQDADQVWFLFRPDEASPECEFIVAKNRSGPSGQCAVHFNPQFVTFCGVGINA